MTIEFWWPYKGKDDAGIESNGRFRKARVVKTSRPNSKKVKSKMENFSESGLAQSLTEELGVSSALLMRNDWEEVAQRVSTLVNCKLFTQLLRFYRGFGI